MVQDATEAPAKYSYTCAKRNFIDNSDRVYATNMVPIDLSDSEIIINHALLLIHFFQLRPLQMRALNPCREFRCVIADDLRDAQGKRP